MNLRTKPSRAIGILNPTVYFPAYEAAYAAAYHRQYTVDDAEVALQAAKAAYHRTSVASDASVAADAAIAALADYVEDLRGWRVIKIGR